LNSAVRDVNHAFTKYGYGVPKSKEVATPRAVVAAALRHRSGALFSSFAPVSDFDIQISNFFRLLFFFAIGNPESTI